MPATQQIIDDIFYATGNLDAAVENYEDDGNAGALNNALDEAILNLQAVQKTLGA